MTLQVGRLTFPEPLTISEKGSTGVSIIGNYKASSVVDGQIRRDQLLGMVGDADVPIIPVILGTVAGERFTGYYRVLDASFVTDEFTRQQGNLYNYQLDLERIVGFTQPLFESVFTGGLLVNSQGVVAGDLYDFHAVPGAATEYWKRNSGSSFQRSSEDGAMYLAANFGSSSMNTTSSFAVDPAHFYTGAARIEQGTPNLLPVVGRYFTQPDTVNWRLSNGMIRVTTGAGPSLSCSWWNGASWTTAKGFSIIDTFNGNSVGSFTAITILRNAPEEVVIRLSVNEGASSGSRFGSGRQVLDLSLRRGDRMVRGYMASDHTNDQCGLWRDVVEAATAITFGSLTKGAIRATSNDAGGGRYVMVNAGGLSNDLVNGRLVSGGSLIDFGIGYEVGGSGAVAPDDATSLARQYFTSQSETSRVVLR